MKKKKAKVDKPKGLKPEDTVYQELIQGMEVLEFINAFYNGSMDEFFSENPEVYEEVKKKFLTKALHKDILLAWAEKNSKLTEEQKKALAE